MEIQQITSASAVQPLWTMNTKNILAVHSRVGELFQSKYL